MLSSLVPFFAPAGLDQAGWRIAFLVWKPRCKGAPWKDYGGYPGTSGSRSVQHV
jgi:hypothetical protein